MSEAKQKISKQDMDNTKVIMDESPNKQINEICSESEMSHFKYSFIVCLFLIYSQTSCLNTN